MVKANLPPRMKAKEGSSRRRRFVEENGDDVFELEAVPVDTLQQMIVLDLNAFEQEVAAEKAEAAELHLLRLAAQKALANHAGPDGPGTRT